VRLPNRGSSRSSSHEFSPATTITVAATQDTAMPPGIPPGSTTTAASASMAIFSRENTRFSAGTTVARPAPVST
jgi:hypothetical protein